MPERVWFNRSGHTYIKTTFFVFYNLRSLVS